MFDDILVPTDGSTCAAVALSAAEAMAKRYGATIHLLSVADARIEDHTVGDESQHAAHEAIVRDARENLSAEIGVVEAVERGLPHEAIVEYADEASVDLVIMGTHGRTGVQRYVLGSVTEKVLRLAETPVLTVRGEDADVRPTPFEDVLIPTDGSDAANAAIDPALDIAGAYDARVHTLSAIEPLSMGVDVRSHVIVEALEERAQAAVDGVAERAESASLGPIETAVEFGDPYRQIRNYVEENDIDLVVMGTHGRSGVERFLLGSVTEKLVRTSAAPVMTVRQPENSGD
ncbi:universal stress protein (plasmid) [Halomicrobium sp. HM KBTZ05]|uniref:universal stress protein n=1 Tax=Halomicrobium sp. HM KBTZ05 TaxID=3242663 RepID=UPI0035562B7E